LEKELKRKKKKGDDQNPISYEVVEVDDVLKA
jgi:hypothetical protein